MRVIADHRGIHVGRDLAVNQRKAGVLEEIIGGMHMLEDGLAAALRHSDGASSEQRQQGQPHGPRNSAQFDSPGPALGKKWRPRRWSSSEAGGCIVADR